MSDHYQEEDEQLSLRDAISVLKGSAGDYMAARRELLQIESKEAAYYLGKKLTLAVILAVVGFFAYSLFWVIVIQIVSGLLAGSVNLFGSVGVWPLVALVVLLGHVVALVVLVKKLKSKPDFELFGMTKSEIEKDKQWLEEIN